jgi:hypothetical protein
MKRKAVVSFVLVVLFLVPVFPLSISSGSADSYGSPGLLRSQSTVDPMDWWPMFHHDLAHTGYSASTAPNTNQILWNCATGNSVGSSPVVAGGVVYVGSADYKVYALDAMTGTQVWSYTTGSCVLSSPAVAGDVVYVSSYDGNVYALNAATGTLIWSYSTGSYVFSSPAVVDGFVYVGSGDGNVYALNAATGAFVWSYTTGNQVFSSPAVVGGVVYVGSWDGNVYAFGGGVHDVAVIDVASSEIVVDQGFRATINVTVANQGGYTETFNVTAYANVTAIQTETLTITSQNSATFTFTWNTIGFALGNYTISAYAWPVQGETDIADNTFVGGVAQIVQATNGGGGGGGGGIPYMK